MTPPLFEDLDPSLKSSPAQANNASSETLIQPRSQGSLLPTLRSERERTLRTKLTLIVSSYLADGRRRLVPSLLLLLLPGYIQLYLIPTRTSFCFPL